MEPVRFGLVGVGGMGGSHLKESQGATGEARFTALCDVNRAALEEKSAQSVAAAYCVAGKRANLASFTKKIDAIKQKALAS